jgi:hypothetical protein
MKSRLVDCKRLVSLAKLVLSVGIGVSSRLVSTKICKSRLVPTRICTSGDCQ